MKRKQLFSVDGVEERPCWACGHIIGKKGCTIFSHATICTPCVDKLGFAGAAMRATRPAAARRKPSTMGSGMPPAPPKRKPAKPPKRRRLRPSARRKGS